MAVGDDVLSLFDPGSTVPMDIDRPIAQIAVLGNYLLIYPLPESLIVFPLTIGHDVLGGNIAALAFDLNGVMQGCQFDDPSLFFLEASALQRNVVLIYLDVNDRDVFFVFCSWYLRDVEVPYGCHYRLMADCPTTGQGSALSIRHLASQFGQGHP